MEREAGEGETVVLFRAYCAKFMGCFYGKRAVRAAHSIWVAEKYYFLQFKVTEERDTALEKKNYALAF
ncbi:hypothetical protein [Hominifimenecus sp. rT4P-3]|uniref:hypothetical protein n=1 Tax=Hominifimenecus sp. rT4P-3 TaxID=3242979 RepID=UPI003DA56B84